MDLYCLEDFKIEFDKLKNKKSYRTIESEITAYFFDKPVEALCSGTRLNNSDEIPYVKKRIAGKGGFRCYYLLDTKKKYLCLMFIHPKTGVRGADNIKDDYKVYLYKKVLEDIKTSNLFRMSLNASKTQINFTKIQKAPITTNPNF